MKLLITILLSLVLAIPVMAQEVEMGPSLLIRATQGDTYGIGEVVTNFM